MNQVILFFYFKVTKTNIVKVLNNNIPAFCEGDCFHSYNDSPFQETYIYSLVTKKCYNSFCSYENCNESGNRVSRGIYLHSDVSFNYFFVISYKSDSTITDLNLNLLCKNFVGIPDLTISIKRDVLNNISTNISTGTNKKFFYCHYHETSNKKIFENNCPNYELNPTIGLYYPYYKDSIGKLYIKDISFYNPFSQGTLFLKTNVT